VPAGQSVDSHPNEFPGSADEIFFSLMCDRIAEEGDRLLDNVAILEELERKIVA
jgi:hypothetical protein